MSIETNMEVVREWVEQVWNRGDVESISQFQPATFLNEGHESTLEEAKQWHLGNRAVFPDIHYTIDEMFACDDRVVLRWRAKATHAGTLWGMIPPTHQSIEWNGIHLLRLANKKIVEVWAIQNTSSQLQQMGVTLQPATEAG